MKKFFAKASKPFAINPDIANGQSQKNGSKNATNSRPSVDATNTPHITTGLQPKYTVPAVPHPCPHDHLAIGVAREGLLIRPYDPRTSRKALDSEPSSFLKVSWRTAEVVEYYHNGKLRQKKEAGNEAVPSESSALLEQANWDEAVIVYGIVGVLELFSCSYLLVISSRGEVGNVLDPSYSVYSVNGVTAIPLVEDRAQIALTSLSSRNVAMARQSLLVARASDPLPSASDVSCEPPLSSPPRVQFSTEDDVKIMTPTTLTPSSAIQGHSGDDDAASIERPSSALSFQSDISTPSSENSIATSPVFKTLASRLSFWSRLSKRTATPDDQSPNLSEFPLTDVVQPTSLAEEREALDKLMKEQEEPAKVVEAIVNATAPPPVTTEEKHKELEDKVIREVIRELTKGGMYFAYTFDITRSLQHKQEQVAKSQKRNDLLQGLGAISPPPDSPPASRISYHPKLDGGEVLPLAESNPTLPLWRRVDRQFWWNECMAKPFIDAGVHPYVLPIMQGYFQAAVLPIPVNDDGIRVEGEEVDDEEVIMADYIIVSRRSRYRAGLRYQRRGVDEEAHVANFVETETILRIERDRHQNVFSYVQIRGSVPLFWTQSGYSLKPPPVLAPDRTHDQNLEALSKHFKRTLPLYGPHTIVNLAEQAGREGAITQAYREYAVEFNDKDVTYCEYDFHKETKGMKYENISKLVESMEKVFASQGYLWISDHTALSHQKGVFRVNCIDCLDRTNVVQSAFARYVLSQQLSAVAVRSPLVGERSEVDLIFNDVWANNGDAISRAYAGTSALKGDFTRTGKRDLSGMLNDGVNSLARMYTATFGDWFSQAVIDFMLGYRTKAVFSEFLLKLQSTDPRDLIRLSKIRAEAVATCASRVLPDGEHLRSGWTLFSPEDVNVKVAMKFEEKVLLLSSKALYIVSYDYTLEKVKLYIRVPLGDIVGITKGAYILSPLEESSRDPEQNYGFVITWLTRHEESRVTSYSVRNDLSLPLARSTAKGGSLPNSPLSAGPLTHKRASRSSIGSLAGLKSPGTGGIATRSPGRRNTMPPLSPGSGTVTTATVSSVVAPSSKIGSFFSIGTKKSNATATDASTTAATGTGKSKKSIEIPSSAEKSFAAFKVLPVDPARIRRASSGVTPYSDVSDEFTGAGSCREAANAIVETIYRACEDAGSGSGPGFVVEGDIVSLAEAQRMTSMFAKMEYGLKRLLWLGG